MSIDKWTIASHGLLNRRANMDDIDPDMIEFALFHIPAWIDKGLTWIHDKTEPKE